MTSSSALPPLAGVGPGGAAKDDRDEQRLPKVKPLPLMLSTRAPLLVPVGGSSSQGGGASVGRSRSGTAQHPSSGGESPALQPASPSSPASTQHQAAAAAAAYRSKFTRIRGIAGAPGGPGGQAQMLSLEGAGMQHQHQHQHAGSAPASRPGTGSGPVAGAEQQQQPLSQQQPLHYSWDGPVGHAVHVPPLPLPLAWGSPIPGSGPGAGAGGRPGSGPGRSRVGSAGSGPAQVTLTLPAEAAMPVLAQPTTARSSVTTAAGPSLATSPIPSQTGIASPFTSPVPGDRAAAAAAGTSRPATSATVFSLAAAAAGGGPPPPTAASTAPPRSRGAAAGTLADLSAALQKSIAAGMGEWDLRGDAPAVNPEVQQRLLRGPLGPETLKNRYRLQEKHIIALYRLLYSYSVGFFSDVEALMDVALPLGPTRGGGGGGAGVAPSVAAALGATPALRQELLEGVFRAYAALWDEAFMIVFDSEMTSLISDKNAALQALDAGVVELEALRRENEQLQARRSVNAGLREEVGRMQAEVARANGEAAESDRIADKYKARWESGRMLMEDLEGANRKLTQKNAELVRSYWPLMARLRAAEAEAEEARRAAAADREAAAVDRQDADFLRAEAEANRAALRELRELAGGGGGARYRGAIPPEVLSALPDAPAAALKRFGRACHRRVAHLTSQVVALVDQVSEARRLISQLQEGLAAAMETSLTGGGLTAADAAAAAAKAVAIAAANAAAGASTSGYSLLAAAGGGGAAAAAAAAAAANDGGEAAAPAPPPEAAAQQVAELQAAVAARDKWLGVLVKSMSQLMSQMENLMARDWETCRTLRIEQQRRKQRVAREARRAASRREREAAGLPPTAAEPSRASLTTSLPASPRRPPGAVSAEPTLAPEASPDSALHAGGGSEASTGALAADTSLGASASDGRDPERLPQDSNPNPDSPDLAAAIAERAPREGGDGGEEEEEDGDDDVAADPSLGVATGRLAQLLGAGGGAEWVERSPALVSLDRGFDRLADSAERLVEWAEGLLKRKEQSSRPLRTG
ncbi:hypothetical protein GPECTOR_10g1037 [Gonium pectorale]|uniref:Uncharacterized protein n=1 Tax=Gonium pectorale TaxID=33097 RepID=A0A150GQF0_GONPE|nr:hypothetical protein GPECTOR_10g1037 [Gonium pectorale]|eukprot:KXZ52014.1 hypothetical protein GPECTOR_10g1037 [Gonium pectorale]